MKNINVGKIWYDPHRYQVARQYVRDARRNLDKMNLPEKKKRMVLEVSTEVATSALKFYKEKKSISLDSTVFNNELIHQATMKIRNKVSK